MSISKNFANLLASVLLSLISVLPVWGFSRHQRLRISLCAPIEAKPLIDSIASNITGVCNAEFIVSKGYIFVVYDRSKTTRKMIITTLKRQFQNKKLNFATECYNSKQKEVYEKDIDG